jgi:hypothetical protein
MMDIEIHDGDLFKSILMQCMGGAHGNIVKNTEPHCPLSLGVVTRRSHTAKHCLALARHHQLDAEHDRAGGPESGREGVRIHAGIWIQPYLPFFWRLTEDFLNVLRIMRPA